MCRNIKTLFNFDPPATDDEIRAASLQFVRKLGGFNKPSKANAAAFMVAIDAITYEQYKEVSMTTKQKTQELTKGFTDDERAAMKERAKELKAEARRKKNREEGEHDLLEKIAEMPEPDRSMATRLHELITANAPDLMPKTWYGMPAYANSDGKVICFFQSADKFGARYATFGFNDTATLDDGAMWPTAFALKALTATEEERIVALVKQAAS